MEKKQYDINEGVAYRMAMDKKGISKYKPIGTISKIVGYSLIGYSIVGFDFGIGMFVGCSLLGIPHKVVISKLKHYGKKVLYCLSLPFSKEFGVKYHYNLFKMRLFK